MTGSEELDGWPVCQAPGCPHEPAPGRDRCHTHLMRDRLGAASYRRGGRARLRQGGKPCAPYGAWRPGTVAPFCENGSEMLRGAVCGPLSDRLASSPVDFDDVEIDSSPVNDLAMLFALARHSDMFADLISHPGLEAEIDALVKQMN